MTFKEFVRSVQQRYPELVFKCYQEGGCFWAESDEPRVIIGLDPTTGESGYATRADDGTVNLTAHINIASRQPNPNN